MGSPGWPARLEVGDVRLRPLRLRDGAAWLGVRRRNTAWLQPWEATPPDRPLPPVDTWAVFLAMQRELSREARTGSALPFVLEYQGRLAGQLAVRNIVRGALNSGSVGYWIDGALAGRGLTTVGLALLTDHCFRTAGLHRIEANIRPENAASRRVVDKLGFRDEGVRRRLLHVDGAYRDHICYALTVEDLGGGALTPSRDTPGGMRDLGRYGG